MTNRALRWTDRDRSTPDDDAALGAASARPQTDEPTLDQLLAVPIVQQLMRRDQTNEATIRHQLQETAAALTGRLGRVPALHADLGTRCCVTWTRRLCFHSGSSFGPPFSEREPVTPGAPPPGAPGPISNASPTKGGRD